MLQKLFHIICAITVLLSSSGFVIQKHYCQNELKEYSLYWKSSGCDKHKAQKPACPFHPEPVSEDKGCCDDEIEFVKLAHPYTLSSFNLAVLDSQHFVGPTAVIIKMGFTEPETSPSPFLSYKPPPLVRNFPVSLQTFLL